MVNRKDRGFDILVYPEKCVVCLICQLRCSLRLTNSFNPARAAILINGATSGLGAGITFTQECDSCGICARHCPYGALELRRKKGANNDGD